MYSYNRTNLGLGGLRITPAVKNLLIANGIVFILNNVFMLPMLEFFGLIPRLAFNRFFLWQFVTYLFLHGNFIHLFFNMYALYVFGTEVERMWGSKAFYRYYFITGIGAGLIHALITPVATIGASGAVMGVLTAYAVMFPDRVITLLLFFIFPVRMKARTLALIFAGMSILGGIMGSRDGVAHFAHLGGMLIGYLYLKQDWRFAGLKNKYYQWKRQRNMQTASEKEEELAKLRRGVDQILDKANEIGMKNLSREEKFFLKRASKIINRNG